MSSYLPSSLLSTIFYLFLSLTNVKLLSNIIYILSSTDYFMSSPLLSSPYHLPYLTSSCCPLLFKILFYVTLSSQSYFMSSSPSTLYLPSTLPLHAVTLFITIFYVVIIFTILFYVISFHPLLTIYPTLPIHVVTFSSQSYFMLPSLHKIILCCTILPPSHNILSLRDGIFITTSSLQIFTSIFNRLCPPISHSLLTLFHTSSCCHPLPFNTIFYVVIIFTILFYVITSSILTYYL